MRPDMKHLCGIRASSGIAIGPAWRLRSRVQIEERSLDPAQIAAELARFEAAIVATDAAMAEIASTSLAPHDLGVELVDVHRALLHSDDLTGAARRLICERSIAAEWALRLARDQVRHAFLCIENEQFRERLQDIESVVDHLLRCLLGLPELRLDGGMTGAIAIGSELSPLDALQLHRVGIAGFATERGGPTSHESIIARSLGIPYVFGVQGLMEQARADAIVGIDGVSGTVILDPDEATLRALELQRERAAARRRVVQAASASLAITLDGTRLSLGANIESAGEVGAALAAGADHIGLVRTELLYLDRTSLPSEEEQLWDALRILQAAGGRPVTFRTLDIGGDKLPLCVRLAAGPNPSLGLRGIRYSLRRPDLFRTQLRALYRAAVQGPLQILFPLVSSVAEIREARSVCQQVCEELAAAAIPHEPRVLLGAMIETPSAVLTADHIAAASDFLSVGTNDLIQYAFAADRQNEEMAYLYQPLHPSILRALRQVFVAAAERRCPVSVCGDMAGDPAQAWVLLGLGLRSFSMTARQLPFVKSVLCGTDVLSAEQFAQEALCKTYAQEVEALALDRLGGRFSLELAERAMHTGA